MFREISNAASHLDARGFHRLADNADSMLRRAMPEIPVTSTIGAKGMFGPMWHGTTPENMEKIRSEGFKFWEEEANQGNTRHGFDKVPIPGKGFPYPVHFLGFGVYMTTSQAIAKMFNQNSTKGFSNNTFYLDSDRIIQINFGSINTISKWWISNGYDPELARKDRVAATMAMTNNLKSQCDAVYFLGKGINRLLDGNQICIYDPSKIVRVEKSLEPIVVRKTDGMKGTLLDSKSHTWTPPGEFVDGMRSDGKRRRFFEDQYPWAKSVQPGQTIQDDDGVDVLISIHGMPEEMTSTYLTVKWSKGGTDFNVRPEEVDIIYP